MASDSASPNQVEEILGVLFISILLNGYFFGIVSQQMYQYWFSRYNDPLYVKAFVATQFSVIVVQAVLYWQLAWNIYIDTSELSIHPKSGIWQAPVNSACQLVLILMANAFLSVRVNTLTRSRLQCGLTLGFSTAAFVVGLVNLVTSWKSKSILSNFTTSQHIASVVGYVLQAIAECLIMFFLARALLASRTGIKRSDSVVNQLARNVIQIGLCATLWSIAALGTYFLLPRITVYTIFNATSGSIYTHMIYDGLLSRSKLRTRLADQSYPEIGGLSQSLSHISHVHALEGKQTPGMDRGNGAVSSVTMNRVTEIISDPTTVGEDANSDFEMELSAKSPGDRCNTV
ncbi:hypothetical protein BC827DRAFT_1232195 [Russula dissimulans]|nr:hypothetical protein BC827DRAFT_1232195 [Russula dissimulans]